MTEKPTPEEMEYLKKQAAEGNYVVMNPAKLLAEIAALQEKIDQYQYYMRLHSDNLERTVAIEHENVRLIKELEEAKAELTTTRAMLPDPIVRCTNCEVLESSLAIAVEALETIAKSEALDEWLPVAPMAKAALAQIRKDT